MEKTETCKAVLPCILISVELKQLFTPRSKTVLIMTSCIGGISGITKNTNSKCK